MRRRHAARCRRRTTASPFAVPTQTMPARVLEQRVDVVRRQAVARSCSVRQPPRDSALRPFGVPNHIVPSAASSDRRDGVRGEPVGRGVGRERAVLEPAGAAAERAGPHRAVARAGGWRRRCSAPGRRRCVKRSAAKPSRRRCAGASAPPRCRPTHTSPPAARRSNRRRRRAARPAVIASDRAVAQPEQPAARRREPGALRRRRRPGPRLSDGRPCAVE